jgi:hypothetical protein
VDVTHTPQIEHDELGRGVEHGTCELLGVGEPEIALQLERTCSRPLALDLRRRRRVPLALGRPAALSARLEPGAAGSKIVIAPSSCRPVGLSLIVTVAVWLRAAATGRKKDGPSRPRRA